MSSRPIHPTRIIPAAPSFPPPPQAPPGWSPPPYVPPAPPAPPARFGPPPPPAPRPAPGPLDIHVTVDVVLPGTEPEPTPSWWQRLHIRWVYNAGCLVVALPLSQPWHSALVHFREDSLAGAWTAAVIPLVVLGTLDNARRIEAAGAAPDLWGPKLRAALTRIALWSLVIATATALPVETITYLLTGVRP